MKPLLTLLILLGLYSNSTATIPFAQGRRIEELNVISTRTLQRSISPRFYRSLCISPIQGLIVIRANLVDTHLSGIRIIHSELDGRFDQLAMKLAKEQVIAAITASTDREESATFSSTWWFTRSLTGPCCFVSRLSMSRAAIKFVPGAAQNSWS